MAHTASTEPQFLYKGDFYLSKCENDEKLNKCSGNKYT
jgi:hypothetical protein